MNPDDLARILDELGQRLGPTGERVFALAVRQVVIDGLRGAAFAVVLGILTYVSWRRVSHLMAAEWERWNALPESDKQYPYLNNKPDTILGEMWWYLLPISLGIGACLLASSSISILLNPEYAAIRDLLGAIHP